MKIEMYQKLNEDKGEFYFKYPNIKYTQEQFDYIFKYLNFDKIKDSRIYFLDKEVEKRFYKTYGNEWWLHHIITHCLPEAYEWLKQNWGKNIFITTSHFKTMFYYNDKQELKTVINKVINVTLIKKNEQ